MTLPVIMHINYCENGQTIDEVCKKAVGWGFDGIEFRSKWLNIDQSEEKYLNEIARGVEVSGLKYVLFGYPVNLMTDDRSKREYEINNAIRFFRMAAGRLNLLVCNAFTGNLKNPDESVPYNVGYFEKHGAFAAADEHYEWAAEGYKVLGAVAQELGFRLAFETHMGYLHDRPSSTRKLLDIIDNPMVGANLDYDNIAYLADQPSLKETINILGSSIFYAHLKNSFSITEQIRISTALSEGDINHREYLKQLKSSGFDGPLCIEAPRPGDREWFAQQDLSYVRSLLMEN